MERCETMLKWVLRFFYIMIIIMATSVTWRGASDQRVFAYYNEHVKDYINQPEEFLVGLNTLGLHSHSKDPVYTHHENDGDYQISLISHAVRAYTSNGDTRDGILFHIYNVDITEDGVKVENPIINITVYLSDSIYTNSDGDAINYRTITFRYGLDFPESGLPSYILIYETGYLRKSETDPFVDIIKLRVDYSNGQKDNDGNLIYNPTALLIASNEEVSEAAYLKTENFIIDNTDYRLSEIHDFDTFESDEDYLAIGLITERGSLSQYNGLVWRTMIIYIVIVSALTYVLFFHKHVRARMQAKSYTANHESTQKVKSEAIFKDIEYKDEDRK